ncbi:hypothetical protein P7K49_003890, partial [Saguinus oedipus]
MINSSDTHSIPMQTLPSPTTQNPECTSQSLDRQTSPDLVSDLRSADSDFEKCTDSGLWERCSPKIMKRRSMKHFIEPQEPHEEENRNKT